jgi:photosystem II stability/assembly factor-like uncharacterized protein
MFIKVVNGITRLNKKQEDIIMLKSIDKTTLVHYIILILILLPYNSSAQKFWSATNEFPGSAKTGITIVNDSCIFVGTENSIIRSFNDGKKFVSVLKASAIYTVSSIKSGMLMAGGQGKVFYTVDNGQNWDSVALNSIYPVHHIVESQKNVLYAITGTIDNEYRPVGDGVFFSDYGGKSWTKRNNGLGLYNSCESIAVDKNGRIYLAVSDESVSGLGGLYISDNEGILWEHIDISIDGRDVVPDQIIVGKVY